MYGDQEAPEEAYQNISLQEEAHEEHHENNEFGQQLIEVSRFIEVF